MGILEQIFSPEERDYIEKTRFRFSRPLFASWEELRQETVLVFGGGIYGTGIVDLLLSQGVRPVCMLDSDTRKHGNMHKGIAVKPVDILGAHKDAVVVLTSAHAGSMYEDCSAYAVRTILPIDLPETPMPITPIGLRPEELADKKDLLDFYLALDADSRNILRQFMLCQFTLNRRHLTDIYDPNPYFSSSLMPLIDYSVFCDLGASVGDTLRDYLDLTPAAKGAFHYYAFEPDGESFAELARASAGRNNVVAVNAAVGDRDCRCRTYGTGTGTSLLPEEFKEPGECDVVSLDKFFVGRTPLPTVIKADVEGYEAEALRGAENLLREHRPALILSIYHKKYDFFEIPMFIKSLNLGYAFHVRHQSKSYGETVVYAVQAGAR